MSSGTYCDNEGYWLVHGDFRLLLTISEKGLQYRPSFRKGNEWCWASAVRSSIVEGSLFLLQPDSVEVMEGTDRHGFMFYGSSTYDLYEKDRKDVYTWLLSVYTEKNGWIRFELALDFPKAGSMTRLNRSEPEMLLSLGGRPPYDRGHSLWARTELAGYTRFDHLPNNDFPSLYYRDPFRQAEILLWFDMEAMTWMGKDNMMRFRDYRMGLREASYGQSDQMELGLYGISQSGNRWPEGKNKISYALRVRHEPRQTNDREALKVLVEGCSTFIPDQPEKVFDISWRSLAEGAMQNLVDDACWVKSPTGEWLRPYVDNYSPAWSAVAEWEGKPGNENVGDTPYMIWFQETVLAPLLAIEEIDELHPVSLPAKDRVLTSSLHYYRSKDSVFREYLASNMTDNGTAGTWQYLHAIRDYWWIGEWTGNAEIKQKAMDEFKNKALKLLEKHALIPPTLHNPSTLEKVGPSVSFSVLGYVADLCMNFYRDRHEDHWLDLAKRSLLLLARAPEYAVHQESNQLSLAVLAAAKWMETLGDSNNHDFGDMNEHVQYLTIQSLRQFYWFEETACPKNSPKVRIKGLSTACTPMMYPALWENTNHVLFFASSYYGRLLPDPLVLRFIGYIREHAKSFFPLTLELEGYELPFIPIEDIHTLEISKDPTVGQEIYGTGHVVWSYLLFEAYVSLKQHAGEILTLCLDLQETKVSRASKRRFLICNTGREEVCVKGRFVHLPEEFLYWRIIQSSGLPDVSPAESQGSIDSFTFTLHAKSWIKIECFKGEDGQ